MKSIAALSGLLLVVASGIGCASMTPAEIQAGASVTATLLLNGAVALEPQNKARIQEDVRQFVLANNSVIIPQFFTGANAGQLVSASLTQAKALLGSKISATANGPKIMAIVDIVAAPLEEALASKTSPTNAMTPSQQAQCLALFTTLSQVGATFCNDPTLNPPAPPAPPEVPPPAPPPK